MRPLRLQSDRIIHRVSIAIAISTLTPIPTPTSETNCQKFRKSVTPV